jgi:hypothetical protein
MAEENSLTDLVKKLSGNGQVKKSQNIPQLKAKPVLEDLDMAQKIKHKLEYSERHDQKKNTNED